MVAGSLAFAAFAEEAAKKYPVNIALHTDHCPKDKLDGFVRPLLEVSKERVAKGGLPVFQSHMWDGSAVPLEENLEIAKELLAKAAEAKVVLEIEIGVVGGEEDGVEGGMGDHLYTTPEDALATAEALGLGENGRYLTALTFGNVHGVYKPGNVKLRPEILREAQKAVAEKHGLGDDARPFDLVFHGGSGSLLEEIHEARRLRRDQDERRHRHPVRLHPADRRPHVLELLRRAEGRRRGRRQEDLRPALLRQGRRGRAWPPASSTPARTSAPPAPPSPDPGPLVVCLGTYAAGSCT